MKTENLNTRILAVICGMSVGLAGAAAAQNSQGMTQPEDHMEYEPGEGYHEEEWYDPSDWFDDDFDGIDRNDTDYEYDDVYGWGDYDYDDDNYTATYGEDSYDADWWYDADREVYGDGYYDGYYDGYDGSEHVQSRNYGDDSESEQNYARNNQSNKRYSDGYNSGYEDGKRDRDKNYSADWTYYIYAVPVNRQTAQKSDTERQNDSERKRGDRAEEARTAKMDKQHLQKQAQKQNDIHRVRGNVTKVEQMKDDRLPEQMKDHTVLRVTMDNGNAIITDLGPKAPSGAIEKGDRVTICGKKMQKDGHTILDAHRLSINDKVMWNTNGNGEPSKVSQR